MRLHQTRKVPTMSIVLSAFQRFQFWISAEARLAMAPRCRRRSLIVSQECGFPCYLFVLSSGLFPLVLQNGCLLVGSSRYVSAKAC